jgi:hypothetical protein
MRGALIQKPAENSAGFFVDKPYFFIPTKLAGGYFDPRQAVEKPVQRGNRIAKAGGVLLYVEDLGNSVDKARRGISTACYLFMSLIS